MMFLAPVVYGVFKYDANSKQSLKEKFSLNKVNASVTYFPETVDYHGTIEIFNINAVDPDPPIPNDNQTPNDNNNNDPNNSDITSTPNNNVNNNDNNNDQTIDDNKSSDQSIANKDPSINPQQESATATAKKHFRSFSKKSMKWFSKIKKDAVDVQQQISKKIEESIKDKSDNDNDNNNDQKDQKDEPKTAEEMFTDNIQLKAQLNIPNCLNCYLLGSNVIGTTQDIHPLITDNKLIEYKWIECDTYIHQQCMYILINNKWQFLSFLNNKLHFVPLSINNNDNKSYFYWADDNNNYIIGRCHKTINKIKSLSPSGTATATGIDENKVNDNDANDIDEEYNFINMYIKNKTEIISSSITQTDFIRKLWIIHEDMLKAKKDTIDNVSNNISTQYHRNEFELGLKVILSSQPDIRLNYWGKFDDFDVCSMDDCNIKFSTFTARKHHCYVCGRVICDKCGKNKFVNPITGLEERACNGCFSKWYMEIKKPNAVYNLKLNELIVKHNKKLNKGYWNKNTFNMIKDCALLSHWIYDGQSEPQLITSLGFKQHKLTKYGELTQLVQYAVIEPLDNNNNSNIIYLVYRGSYDIMDWVTNFQTYPLKVSELGFKVHNGMYCSLQQHVLEYLIKNLCKNLIIPNNKKLCICGHSLGGGYSQLSAAYILSQNSQFLNNYFNKNNLSVITFGGPLVLEKDISLSSPLIGSILNSICINFVNQFDLIPRIGEGVSLDYLKHLTSKTIDDNMKKLWGLKTVDRVFNLNVKQRVSSHLFERSDIKNLGKITTEVYGPIGKYYLLFDKYKPKEVIDLGKNKGVFVRQLPGKCIDINTNKLLTLLPKRSGLFANHMLYDHFMNNYLTQLFFLDL